MRTALIVFASLVVLAGSAHAKKKKIPTVAEAKRTCLAANPTMMGTALGECIKKEKRGAIAAARSK